MFNGYHEPSATSYNDLDLDRAKKNQSASKWTCGNGSSLQSHIHSQNQQSEVWVSKPSYLELSNTTSQKCNCPSCYQLSESQSYQGEMPWHRSWFSRTYPVAVNATHDLVKLPTNHHWENSANFGSESYNEPSGGQFMQESGEKSLYYKPYSGLRHEIYQPGVISTVKKVPRKQDMPKQDEIINIGHHPRYNMSNSSYDPFRTAIDQRLIEERNNYCNQNEKFLNAESCRPQGNIGPYGINSNRRTILESFSKTVPSNTNQNRVPSAEHHTIKDSDFQSYLDQNNIEKTGPHINHGGGEDKHCKTYFQSEVNPGQENLHTGLMNVFSSTTVDYHGMNFNRQVSGATGKDFQKFINGRNPQYYPRSNISDMISRNSNSVLNYNFNRKGVINVSSGSVRAAQNPSKHAEIVTKSSSFGKDCLVPDKMSPERKLIMNNSKMPTDHSYKGSEIPKSDNILHSHITRPIMNANPTDKIYGCVSPHAVYKGCGRSQECSYGHRDMQRSNEYPNGMINQKSDLPAGINIGMSNLSDFRNGIDAYPRVNNQFSNDGTLHQFEKFHYQISGDNKLQSSVFGGTQLTQKVENFRMTEKRENSGRISHLEAIPYEELCKNGTSKISPLRLLRKKKLIHQKKEDVNEIATHEIGTNAKTTSPPLDVRRFWATWAEEEDDNNVLQTQMVVLDCHNIDPEQAGLLHLYNPENIRTVNLEDGNILDIKDTHFEKRIDQIVSVNGKTSDLDKKTSIIVENEKIEMITQNDVLDPVKNANINKTQSHTEFSLNTPVIIDTMKKSMPEKDTKTNVIVQASHFGEIDQSQSSDYPKQLGLLRSNETKWDDSHKQRYFNIEKPVLNKNENISLVDNDSKTDSKTESEKCDFDVSKEESFGSDSSDDSQTENLTALPDLPTSEYRKNKFLDYSDDNFCNGGFLFDGMNCDSNKESSDTKLKNENDCPVEDKLKEFLTSEIGPGSFEIDELLKKLSDINFQGTEIGTESPNMDGSSDKYKTDKKILELKTEKKIKKLSHKSSRTDQVTLQNISLTKPTIKFSIQKSHDLKISFKVLNNKKKHDEKEENPISNGDVEEDHTNDYYEDREVGDRFKKNKRRLITLKVKGVSDGNEEENLWEEDSMRKSKKSMKKKKIRMDRSPSPKTPVLKIKKSRYMMTYGCENGEAQEEYIEDTTNDPSESKDSSHGDFQVHETVDSAKIKLTFKRNKNGKEKISENDDVMYDRIKTSHFKNESVNDVDFCGKMIDENSDFVDTSKDHGKTEYFEDVEEKSNEEIATESLDKEELDTKNESSDESYSIAITCKPSNPESAELLCNPDELMIDDFKKEDIAVDPLDIIDLNQDASLPENLNSNNGIHYEDSSTIEKGDICEDTVKDLPESQIDPLNVAVDEVANDLESDMVIKNNEEPLNDENTFKDSNKVSRLDDVIENNRILDSVAKGEDSTENVLKSAMREALNNPLEIIMENKGDESIDEVVEKHEIDEKSSIGKADEKEKKLDSSEEYRDYEEQEIDNIMLKTTEEVNKDISQQSSIALLDDKVEATDLADQTEYLEYQGVKSTDHCDNEENKNDTNESNLTVNLPCNINSNEEVSQSLVGLNTIQEIPKVGNNPEHPQIESGSILIGGHDYDRELEIICSNDITEEGKNHLSVILNNISETTSEHNVEMGVGDMEVETYEIEQNDQKANESTMEKSEEENSGDILNDAEIEDIIEENNNKIMLYPKETIFINRKVLRRCSDDVIDWKSETYTKRLTKRSMSLNIVMTTFDNVELDVPVLDIAVSDIPLPPGDAPPENCLNLEEYIKSKLLEREKTIMVQDEVKITTTFENSKPMTVMQGGELDEVKPCEPVPEDDVSSDFVNSNLEEQEKQVHSDESRATKMEKINDSIVGSQQKDVEKSSDAEEITEIRIEDLEVLETRDTDITLEESSFRTNQLYECEGLAFDEALTITDDIEEEKVSDDDKFRNIMQNCLDNAKKFLNVGNSKLLSSSVDDPVVVNKTEMKNFHDDVSKNIFSNSCEGNELDPSNNRQQSVDLPVDFVPSFCADIGSHPCSEILPVDNWPYLEEEVASSPIRNKTEDSELLCYSEHISSTKNMILEGKFSAERVKQSRGSLHTDFDVKKKTRSIVERRKTIEGIGRWKAFRSTDEELSDVENFILKSDKIIKGSSTELIRSSKNQLPHRKFKKRIKPYSDSEGNGSDKKKSTFKKNSVNYKTSSWQPKVVLFRISTNNMENLSVLPNKNSSEESSLALCKRAGSVVDQNWDITSGDKTDNLITSRKVREHEFEDGRENVKYCEKETRHRIDGMKRKKIRFRNLHTKKRIVPESSDQTKENKSTADDSSNLVGSESDSDETSPSHDPPKEVICSHYKSTKSSNSDNIINRKYTATEEHLRNGKQVPETASVRCKEKRKRYSHDSKNEMETQNKRYHSDRKKVVQVNESSRSDNNLKFRRENNKKFWVCEVCGFSKISERVLHVQSHPFHCQSCHLAFKTETNFVEHLTRKHKDIRNQHHCLLCELSFDLEKDYYHHLETREHKHLEYVEKNTINTLFRLLTGQPCPVLGPVESKPEWLPTQAGTVHFYHQATPLSLALQYLKLHHDKKKISAGALSPSE